jgi:hypothetical protein
LGAPSVGFRRLSRLKRVTPPPFVREDAQP